MISLVGKKPSVSFVGAPCRSSDSHAFPQFLRVLWALYFRKKRVQYDSGRRAARNLHLSAPGTAREEHQLMELSVTKSALLTELSTTQGVVERKTTIPILSNLLIEAQGSQLTITATDLELSVRTSCEAKIKKEGAGTIPAKKLLELVRLLPEGEIKVKLLENHWVEIVSDKKKYKLVR